MAHLCRAHMCVLVCAAVLWLAHSVCAQAIENVALASFAVDALGNVHSRNLQLASNKLILDKVRAVCALCATSALNCNRR